MQLSTEILQDFEGTISITDYSELENYLAEESPLDVQVTNIFKYSDTCTLNVIKYQNSQKEELLNAIYSRHDDGDSDSIRIPLRRDGYYTVNHLVLPLLEWVFKWMTNSTIADLQLYNYIYFIHDENVYYITNVEATALKQEGFTISSILESAHVVDPQILGEINILGTTISIQNFNIFNDSGLRHCYIAISREILEHCPDKCYKLDATTRFNRDFIWMTLNVIKFYIDEHRFTEAQLVLEQLNCCGICKSTNYGTTKTSNCGCHH